MNGSRIIQIIPAPPGMLLRYKEDNGEMSHWKPFCLALVRHSEGTDEVRIMDIDQYGVIEFADSSANFDGVDWEEATP